MNKAIKRLLDEVCGELHAATIQMIPKDDQIICNHVRAAKVKAEAARDLVADAMKGGGHDADANT